MSYLHSLRTQTILTVSRLDNFTVSRNTNVFVHEKLSNLLSWTFLYIRFFGRKFRKEKIGKLIFADLCLNLAGWNFAFTVNRSYISSLNEKFIWLKFLFNSLWKGKNKFSSDTWRTFSPFKKTQLKIRKNLHEIASKNTYYFSNLAN